LQTNRDGKKGKKQVGGATKKKKPEKLPFSQNQPRDQGPPKTAGGFLQTTGWDHSEGPSKGESQNKKP